MKEQKAEKVVVTLHVWPDPRESLAVFQSLKMLEGPTRARAGCRYVGTYRTSDGPAELVLVEEWDSREAMEAHVRSSDFRLVLAAMDASAREPVFQVDTIGAREGFECVAAILGSGASLPEET